MPVPKTNLFQGDRVKISSRYLTTLKIRNKHAPTGKLARFRGTIISDTLDPRYDVIVVHWDGCKKPQLRTDRGYEPGALELVEEFAEVAA